MTTGKNVQKQISSGSKPLLINTCVFGAERFSDVRDYIAAYGNRIGFEILAMFDLPDFEDRLRENLDLLAGCSISFHGPVYCAEHSAPRGSAEYEETMWHVRKTLEYARILHSEHFVMHLNNCRVDPAARDRMLANALDNYRELRELCGAFGCRVFVENTGTKLQGNVLLDQDEFTDLCRRERFDVLIDIGHANANGWDLYRLIDDLAPQIRAYHLHNNDGIHDLHNRLHDGTIDFTPLMQTIRRRTPDADLIIEYTRRDLAGPTLHEDIREMLTYKS